MPSEAKKKVLESGEYLNESMFVKSLSLCALKSKAFERENTPTEKILHFIEKIMQSTGISKVKNSLGKTRIPGADIDPIIELKKYYGDFFKETKKVSNQDKLLSQVFEGEEAT